MPMRRALTYSFLLHIAVAVLAWVGIPSGGPLTIEPVQIIAVELADVSETPVRAAPKPKAEKEPEPEEPPAPPPAPREEVAAAIPPPPPPKPVEPEPEPVPVPVPSEEKAPEPEPPLLPSRPKPKPVRHQQDDFESVLKTLELLEDETPPQEEPEQKEQKEESDDVLDDVAALLERSDETPVEDAQKAPVLGSRLTMSEIDAVRRQIEPCWNVPVGARNPEELVVELYLRLRPDGSVISVEVVDKARMRTDSFFRAAADSARRAVLNERCTPLKLPMDKYDRWREMTLRFDPSEMVGR